MPLTLLPVCFSGSHLSTCNLWTVGLAIRILDVLFHARIVRGPNGVVSRSQAVGRSRPPRRPVVCSQLRLHPPRQPAGGLSGTVPSIRSRAAVSQYQCRAAERSAGLRARTLVARSIENAGTAHSVVSTFSHESPSTVMPRRQGRGPPRTRTWLFLLTAANAHGGRWLHYRRNETRCATREELQAQVNDKSTLCKDEFQFWCLYGTSRHLSSSIRIITEPHIPAISHRAFPPGPPGQSATRAFTAKCSPADALSTLPVCLAAALSHMHLP